MLHPQGIRVLLVDDHTIVRQGLRALLTTERDLDIVGEAEDGPEAIAMVRDTRPDVVVMDIHLPTMTGIEATTEITSAYPGVRVLGLSMSEDRDNVLKMLRAGARGYLLKQSAGAELAGAIRAIYRNEAALHPIIARTLVDQVSRRQPAIHPDDELTEREKEVLRLIATGMTSREIGAELNLSAKTVDNYRAQILKKLAARNKVEAIASAIRRGLIRVAPAPTERTAA